MEKTRIIDRENKEAEAERTTTYPHIQLDAYEGREPFLFISYSHADTERVSHLLNIIDNEKFRIWYDDTMEIGEDFREELQQKIEACCAFILFVSSASMNSKYCGMEIIVAYKNNKKIYPIFLEDDIEIPPAFKMMLENLQHVKGWSEKATEKYIRKLIAGLPVEAMRSLEIANGVLLECKDGSSSITIPEEVTVIGDGAFKHCVKLEVLKFGANVERIGREAFRGCKKLKKIVIPESVKKIGESAFRDCISLESIVIKNGNIEMGERAFENCSNLSVINLPKEMTEIYGGAFNSCKSLESIELPEKLTIIGESAFADCVSLIKISIPFHTTKIDDMAFNGCNELGHILLSESVTKIGKNAFKDCPKLKEIFIPRFVSNLTSNPFRGCCNLESVSVDPKNKHYKSVDGILFNKNKSTLICYPSQVDKYEYCVPDSVTTISDWAFCASHKLNKIVIPDSVYEIGEGAFYSCTSLRFLDIPDSVIKIDDIAFRSCMELESVTIPDSVTEFGWGVFNGCEKVTVICNNNSAAAVYCDNKRIPHKEKH